jgi:hypothetical protein
MNKWAAAPPPRKAAAPPPKAARAPPAPPTAAAPPPPPPHPVPKAAPPPPKAAAPPPPPPAPKAAPPPPGPKAAAHYVALLVSIVLVIVTHLSFQLCYEDNCPSLAPAKEVPLWDNIWDHQSVPTLHGQVMTTTKNVLLNYIFCANCFFAPQSRIVWWLWKSGEVAYSTAMLVLLELQSHVHKWKIIDIILDGLNESDVISFLPYIVLKVLGYCVLIAAAAGTVCQSATVCVNAGRAALNTAMPVVERARRNWQMIARIVIVVVCLYCYTAFLSHNWPDDAVHQQDRSVSKDSGVVQITKAMKVAVGTCVTSAVGYGLLWLVTQE